MRPFILGLIIGIIFLPLCGLLYFRFGYAPVATASSPMPFEKSLAHMALNARIDKEAPKQCPIAASDENYTAGARIYRENCAVCHGLLDQPQSPTSKGMYPNPPLLFKGHGVTDDPAGETYWKVANGIRLTGMPAYSETLNPTQMWQVSLMLANADKLPQQVKDDLKRPLQQ
jgi:mono/diheme cytochrome c family protein